MLIKLLSILILLHCQFNCLEAKKKFSITGKRLECVSESQIVANMTCQLQNFNSTTSLWTVEMVLEETVDKIFVKISWFHKSTSDTKFRPFLGVVNVTTDLCKYLTEGNSMVVDMFLDDIKKYSNIVQQCPFKGYVYVKELNPRYERFPPIMPSGDYYMWFLFFTKSHGVDQVLISMKAYVEVKTIR